MNKKTVIFVTVLIAILFVSAMAGTIVYYNSAVNDKDYKKTTLLNNQTANQNTKITNLTAQVANLISANLVTALGITEISNTSSISRSFNRLYIEGSVTNRGPETAFDAGLYVVAYSKDGTLEINMTVPLTTYGLGEFGTNVAIYSYLYSFDPYCTPSPKFGNLPSGQSVNVNLDIYHEGTVTNWTVTPTWKNTT